MRRLLCGLVGILCLGLLSPVGAGAFGLTEHDVTFTNADSSPATLAGSHPFAQSTALSFQTQPGPNGYEEPTGAVKDITVSLPPGFVGDTTAVAPCASGDFAAEVCSESAKIGAAVAALFGPPQISGPDNVYDLVPPSGAAARIGFHATAGVPVIIDLKVNPNPPYNVLAVLHDTANAVPIYSSVVMIEGEPAAASKPFLTLPRSCQGPQRSIFQGVSWEEPTVSTPEEPSTSALATTGCSGLGFEPSIAAAGTSPAAESPSGLDFNLNVSDTGLTEQGSRANSDIEKAVVTLPTGFTTNPAVASGLSACSLSQYRSEDLEFIPNSGCPETSSVGTVEVTSPLLAEKLNGQIYVAKQGENETGNNLLGLYMIIRSEERGILVKQPLKVEPDPATGQLRSIVSNIPQLPFSNFHLHFRSGSRAPLISPATCGAFSTEADLYPYAQGVPMVHSTATLSISAGASGGPCANSPGQVPPTSSFSAGTLSPLAGSYSPFVLTLSRPDGSQQFSAIETTLPKGLLGRLSGIPYCPESGIAQATSRGGEGQGALEIAQPSCPSASQVGVVTVASGAGPDPLYVQGTAYLAGPYKGAPLSLEIITPAIAGPFDLGTVAVRTALNIDLSSAQITAVSDPIPRILHGLPLDVRSIAISMNRPDFTLNPTSCEPKAIIGNAISTLGTVSPLSQYFQVQSCNKLMFGPSLSLSLTGKTRRSGHPALKAVLTYPKGSHANIARAQVGLPHSEFLDQGNIGTVCTQPQLKSKTCPRGSIYGKAKAWSPLLEKPLTGPVYLGVGYGHKLPDLVADLDGQIRVLLNGKIDTDPQGGIRNTFEAVPDAPVSRFVLELKGGRKQGLLENSENICKKPQKATAKFTAQNNRFQSSLVTIKNECGQKGRGKKNGKHRKRH